MKILSHIFRRKKIQYTPVDIELEPRVRLEAPDSGSKTWKKYLQGWRFTVATGACLSFCVLWANVGILLWAQKKDASSLNTITLFQGSCPQRDRIMALSHLAINILSTLLLGASSSCMQLLSTPTREEIDTCHSRGVWLDVGLLSWRNLKWISRWRLGAMLLIGASSIPLHLVYNSIIYPTQNDSRFIAILVAQDFVTGGTFEPTAAAMPLCNHTSSWPPPTNDGGNQTTDACVRKNYEAQAPNATQLQQLQDNRASLERLENADCVKKFHNLYEPEYRGVVLVSNVTNNTDSVLQFLDTASNSAWWMCANDWAQSLSSQEIEYVESDDDTNIVNQPSTSCTPTSLASNAANWQMFDPSAADPSQLLDIEYCLAERSKIPGCTIGFSKDLMLVVITFNSVKVLCLVFALKICASPFITIGDAIASFLEHPDPTTNGFGTHSVKNIRQYRAWKTLRHPKPGAGPTAPPRPVPHRWEAPKRRLWQEAPTKLRQICTYSLCLVFWFVPLMLMAADHDNRYQSGAGYQKVGFGSINGSYLLVASLNHSLTVDILLANAPQLALSFIYFIYNGLLTSMVQSAEYLRFSNHSKTLRVSAPAGGQRSTFWLNIPYRYAIPLMIATSVLHWLISQSIFLARTFVWDYNYTIDKAYAISGTGWSNFALLFALILGCLMVFTLLFLGRVGHYPTNMPLAGSNSAAISAACHRREDEAGDIVQRPLRYGVLPCGDAEGRRRVGFSAEDVEPLVSGEIYV